MMVLGAIDRSFPVWLPLLHSQPPGIPSDAKENNEMRL